MSNEHLKHFGVLENFHSLQAGAVKTMNLRLSLEAIVKTLIPWCRARPLNRLIARKKFEYFGAACRRAKRG